MVEISREALDKTIEVQLRGLQTQVNLSAVDAKLRARLGGVDALSEDVQAGMFEPNTRKIWTSALMLTPQHG
jgi:hypothetical protein